MKNIFLFSLFAPFFCLFAHLDQNKPVILVTIPPYAYFVRTIARDLVSVIVLIPNGMNPHIYEPTPRQTEKAIGSSLWFRFGDPIEKKILPFMEKNHVKTVNLTEGISLLTSQGESCPFHEKKIEDKDLHIWLNPDLAVKQAEKIQHQLSILLPSSKQEIENGYQVLKNQLNDLDQDIQKKLEKYKGKYLLSSHSAFQYFCHRYHLHQLSVELEGKDPKPKEIEHIIHLAHSHQIRFVLTQPQYNNKGVLLIAKRLKIPDYQIDPYDENYIEMLSRLTQLIIENYDDRSK